MTSPAPVNLGTSGHLGKCPLSSKSPGAKAASTLSSSDGTCPYISGTNSNNLTKEQKELKEKFEQLTKKPAPSKVRPTFPENQFHHHGSRIDGSPSVDLFVEHENLTDTQRKWCWEILVDGLDGAVIQQLFRARKKANSEKEERNNALINTIWYKFGWYTPIAPSDPPDTWDHINDLLNRIKQCTITDREKRHALILEEAFKYLQPSDFNGEVATCPVLKRAVHTIGESRNGVLKMVTDLEAGSAEHAIASNLMGTEGLAFVHGRVSNGKPPIEGVDPDLQQRNTAGLAAKIVSIGKDGRKVENDLTGLSDQLFALDVLHDYVQFSHDLVSKGNPIAGYFPSWNPFTWNWSYFSRMFALVTAKRPENRLDQSFYSQLVYKYDAEGKEPKYFMFEWIKEKDQTSDADKKLKRFSFNLVEVKMRSVDGKLDRTEFERGKVTKIADAVMVDKEVEDQTGAENLGYSPNGPSGLESVGLIAAARRMIYKANQELREASPITKTPAPQRYMEDCGITF